MALYTHHLPAWKKDEVEDIKKNAKAYKLIGLVDMYGIPAQQVQQIRRNLRGKAVIKVTRNTLIKHAFNEIGGETKNLSKFISGHSAIIFTNDNPFKLFKQLEKTKTKMSAKPGEKAPEDIVIPSGPTSFKPGPIVGELQQAGIPAAIEGGKVRIRETKTVVKKGGVISAKLAAVLAVDETVILGQIALAGRQALALSLEAAIPTKDTMAPLLTKAVRDARGVAIEAAIYEKDVVDAIIGKAERESQVIKNLVK